MPPTLAKKQSAAQRLTVIQLARLGDFLQTTPLLAALNSQKDKIIQTVVQPAQAALAWASGLVDQVYLLNPHDLQDILQQYQVWPLKAAQLKGQLDWLKDIKSDTTYNLNFSHLAALASGYVNSGQRRGWHFVGRKLTGEDWMAFVMAMAGQRRFSRMHLSDILASYADPPAPLLTRLAFIEQAAAQQKADALLGDISGPVVALQLGANHRLRRWPSGNFVGLARQLISQGASLVLVGSHTETPLARKFMQRLSDAPLLNLMGLTDIPTLASVLARMDLVVSSDTGTLHLATAVGTTCLALYMGPAQVHETGPYGEAHLTLQARQQCAPCVEANPVCKGQAPCRYLINPDMASRAAMALLQRHSPAQVVSALAIHNDISAFAGRFDSFGLSYQPLDNPPLNLENALALSLREMGRVIQRSQYQGQDMGKEINAAYRPDRTADRKQMELLLRQMRELALASDNFANWPAELHPALEALRSLEKNKPARLAQAWQAAAQTMEICLAY